MRIALFSDIHGNDVAFRAAEADAKARGAELFVLAGDMITDFPMTSQVLARARRLAHRAVLGNREEYYLNFCKNPGGAWFEYEQHRPLLHAFSKIGEADGAWIAALSGELTLALPGGRTMKVVHRAPPRVYHRLDQNEMRRAVAEYFAGAEGDVVVVGHTHKAGADRAGDTLVVNAGSVGLNYQGRFTAEYVLLDCREEGVSAEIATADYDKEELVRAISVFERSEDATLSGWAALLMRTQAEGYDYFKALFDDCEAQKRERGLDAPLIPNDIWKETLARYASAKG